MQISISTLFDVFSQLALALNRNKGANEPLSVISDSLKEKIGDITDDLYMARRTMEEQAERIERLKDQLHMAKNTQVLSPPAPFPTQPYDSRLAKEVLNRLVTNKVINADEPEIHFAIKEFYRENGQKIWTIKFYREITGKGLKEAKDAVEEILGL